MFTLYRGDKIITVFNNIYVYILDGGVSIGKGGIILLDGLNVRM